MMPPCCNDMNEYFLDFRLKLVFHQYSRRIPSAAIPSLARDVFSANPMIYHNDPSPFGNHDQYLSSYPPIKESYSE
jgi:hypothetical protein